MEYEKFQILKNNKHVINVQNNSVNGFVIVNQKKMFFKIIDEDKFLNEMNGYLICHGEIPVMKLIQIDKLDNLYIILYEYNNDIGQDKGTLNDFFVENDEKKDFDKTKYTSICEIFNKNLKKSIYTINSKNKIFFHYRVDSRLISWYHDFELLNKNIVINSNKIDIRKLIMDTKSYFDSIKEEECFFSAGDPNTLNISITPCFFDLETCGYNSIIGEFAITLISVLFYDNYFCPKYHKNSFFYHELTLNIYNKYSPLITVKKEDNNNLELKCKFKTSKVRKAYILDYLKILKNNEKDFGPEILYYFVMRLLCTFNLKIMERSDQYYTIYLIAYFYDKLNNKENILDILEKIIFEMED